jgi:hypothetical protein
MGIVDVWRFTATDAVAPADISQKLSAGPDCDMKV